ncbi:hypothetical protein [Mesorhizobium sp. M6A.T.Ce.TU.016.01.1.1]|uniref:hypothetical protein n=1 Tax=Mesorhizobium sp. M6A.T.Ce.TU.016.01.1.1 TaxID=2496783 RepID=UPI000FCA1B72|nr:hypothetical protein [Mesorhizobium sp. M6A.T.Ce.TU.016.01.1.1]RUU29744.1 hypothetical protein EOC94_12815 [Mesorhizobium sp. M6A.T.Ce.TU.016.01.1.1]
MAEATLRKLDLGLPRLDMRSPALIAKQKAEQAQHRPPRRIVPAPVHVAFHGHLAEGLRQCALGRGESPQVLAAALLARLLETDMANDLIGDGRAEYEAGGQGRRPFGDAGQLTLRQCAVIHLIGTHASPDGWCRLSIASLTKLLPHEGKHVVPQVLTALEHRGVLVRGRRYGTGTPTPWSLSEAGKIVFDILAGEAG